MSTSRTTTLIRNMIPAARCHFDDFKCPVAGDSEDDLLRSLARLAQLEVKCEAFRVEGGAVTLELRCGDHRDSLRVQHRKYYFPPRELLAFLNDELERANRGHRLVACISGLPWQGGDGEAIVLATANEIAELEACGLLADA